MCDAPICCWSRGSCYATSRSSVSDVHETRGKGAHSRQDVGTRKRRCILDVVVAGHVFRHDSDGVALALGEQVGRREAGHAAAASALLARPVCSLCEQQMVSYPTTTMVLVMVIIILVFN